MFAQDNGAVAALIAGRKNERHLLISAKAKECVQFHAIRSGQLFKIMAAEVRPAFWNMIVPTPEFRARSERLEPAVDCRVLTLQAARP